MEGSIKTGLLQGLALKFSGWFGKEFTLVALALLAGIGMLSSLLANIPVVAASLVITKGYLIAVEAVPETALAASFSDWPAAVVPVFIAMMFGGTLGGNATLIGASSNVVSAGICAREGSRVTFGRFLRIGLPVTFCQLAASALYNFSPVMVEALNTTDPASRLCRRCLLPVCNIVRLFMTHFFQRGVTRPENKCDRLQKWRSEEVHKWHVRSSKSQIRLSMSVSGMSWR